MRPIRTLIVDDSEDLRILVRLMLQSEPMFEVCGEAADGEEALAVAAACAPDAIVLDLMMPVMDGLTALPLLRDLCPSAPIVVLTGSVLPDVTNVATELGASAVVVKSVGASELIQTLTSVIRAGLVPPPAGGASRAMPSATMLDPCQT